MTRRRSLALLAACALGCEPLVSGPSLSGQERTFRPLGPLGAASHLTASVNLGDVDGDGSLDVVVANGRHWPEQNRIFLNDGRGGFTLARRLGDEEDGTYAAPLADFDGDGDLDLVLANRDGGANAIQWNDAGAFDRRTIYGTGSDETRGVAVGDVDGDGIPDLVVANIGEENAVYFGHSDGSFARSRPFGRDDDQSYAVSLADLDLDSDLDIVVANAGARNAVYFNHGSEGGSGFEEFRFGCDDCSTYGIAVGDLNGDGFPEIVTANSGAPNVIFANIPAADR
ncbi:FG-GAP repeat domain-containing protein [Candidatus Palauibacter sp.]|uniref:FG-GAP repeat domain-containing protein n=1 Tax=Candidatus Palauibacter sp. TaxID=3101350 RepID=UPI003AF27A24